ncbi:ABC transporter permease subunit [Streptomyces erythrochromogenes]|uniref:ABC transporter permease subunit n=1 Tax=Streptomyces erythrochromogenes TaxID=285574 RepID=UPI00342CEB98
MTGENLRSTFLDGEQIKEALPALLTTGLLNTCVIAALAGLFGSALALALSKLGASRLPGLRAMTRLHVHVFRGLPVILTVMLIGQGLPMAGVHLLGRDGFPYAVLVLAPVNAAYLSEIIRSGMQSVERELVEAALTFGMTERQATNRIVLPLGIRRVLPALANQFIVVVKETSLV